MKSRNIVLGLLALVILAVVGLVGLMMRGDPETPVGPEDGTPAENLLPTGLFPPEDGILHRAPGRRAAAKCHLSDTLVEFLAARSK